MLVFTLLVSTVDDGYLPYAVTDILINYSDGFVRRGLGGELSLALSRFIGGAPAFWGWAILASGAAVLFVLAIRLYRRLPDDPIYLPFVLAPFGLLFMVYDPQSSIRKETFGYIALLLILHSGLAPTKTSMRLLSGLGAVVFLISLFLHEALLLMWPSFAMGLWLLSYGQSGAKRWSIMLACVTGIGGLVATTVLLLRPAPDSEILCVAAGVDPCGGAIYWVGTSLSDSMAFAIEHRPPRDYLIYLVFCVLSLVSFRAIHLPKLSSALQACVLGLPLVAVTPLFLVGFDWGRWLHMALFPLSLLAVAGVLHGVVIAKRAFPPWMTLLYVCTWNLPHAVPGLDMKGLCLLVALGVVVAAKRVLPA